ncbi:MAG: DUF6398 domain-containing protein [Pirellulales bacterium]
MIFRLSQRLKNKIKAGQLSDLPLHENPYADWSARLFTADRSQYILLSHTTSLYSVVMFGRGITHDGLFIDRALDSIREFMTDDGLGLIYMNFIAPASASIRFCKALNRSVTGSMNELVIMAKLHLESGECSPFGVGFKLNGIPLSAVAVRGNNYATPREAFSQIKPGAADVTQGSTSSRSNDMPAKNRDTSHQSTTPKRKNHPACGLCGNTKNLTKTECCDNWICDDEQDYVMFSYARNSCYRNHRRYTLCGFHHAEGHEGRWQDCAECRDLFEAEMYVHYGTNEYNFEKLSTPPAYEPTHCHQCGRVISLGEDGYSIAGGEYFCQRCTTEKMGGGLLPPDDDEPDTANDSTPAQSVPGGMHPGANPGGPNESGLQELTSQVPEAYRDRFDAIVERTDTFCDRHLNDEYKQLSREMAASICQKGSPVRKGKPESWAAGVIYALGRVNFLTDPSQSPHMKSDEIATGIGVSPATMQAKAKVIREGLDLMAFDPEWSLPSRMGDNPLVWMLEVNGMLIDIRMAPREAQVVAYEKGLIPYIPAGRHES